MLSTLCQYEEPAEGVFVCSRCGNRRNRRAVRECDIQEPDDANRRVYVTVGQMLKYIIHRRYAIPPCKSCHETAAKMDRLGVPGCRENLTDLAEELQSNAVSMNWRQLISAATSRKAVSGAISAIRQGVAFYESLILEACEATEKCVD